MYNTFIKLRNKVLFLAALMGYEHAFGHDIKSYKAQVCFDRFVHVQKVIFYCL